MVQSRTLFLSSASDSDILSMLVCSVESVYKESISCLLAPHLSPIISAYLYSSVSFLRIPSHLFNFYHYFFYPAPIPQLSIWHPRNSSLFSVLQAHKAVPSSLQCLLIPRLLPSSSFGESPETLPSQMRKLWPQRALSVSQYVPTHQIHIHSKHCTLRFVQSI